MAKLVGCMHVRPPRWKYYYINNRRHAIIATYRPCGTQAQLAMKLTRHVHSPSGAECDRSQNQLFDLRMHVILLVLKFCYGYYFCIIGATLVALKDKIFSPVSLCLQLCRQFAVQYLKINNAFK